MPSPMWFTLMLIGCSLNEVAHPASPCSPITRGGQVGHGSYITPLQTIPDHSSPMLFVRA